MECYTTYPQVTRSAISKHLSELGLDVALAPAEKSTVYNRHYYMSCLMFSCILTCENITNRSAASYGEQDDNEGNIDLIPKMLQETLEDLKTGDEI